MASSCWVACMAGVADEAPLIARIAAGDTAALRELFARHHIRVYRFIDALSPEHKGIVDLVYYHEMSIAEAAEVLQIPENTVKTRLFHARRRLSELLERAGIDRGWP